MAKLVLNPNSIYTNSQANFVLNKEALYAFTRSVSAINDSVYGMQPTRAQLLTGFTLSDVYAVNPKDTNYSLCATVDKMQDGIDVMEVSLSALKFFATKPFEVYDSVSAMSADAKNPLALYLTPIFKEETETLSVYKLILDPDNEYEWRYVSQKDIDEWNAHPEEHHNTPVWEDRQYVFSGTVTETTEVPTTDHYEWIYVLPDTISSWEQMEEIYKGEYYLSSLSGEWELVGSTSFTDDKLSNIFKDFYNTLISAVAQEKAERVSADDELDRKIDDTAENIRNEISVISSVITTDVEDKYDYLNGKIDKEIQDRISSDEALHETLHGEISAVSSEITSVVEQALEEMSDEIEDLSGKLNDEISSRISADDDLKNTISTISSELTAVDDALCSNIEHLDARTIKMICEEKDLSGINALDFDSDFKYTRDPLIEGLPRVVYDNLLSVKVVNVVKGQEYTLQDSIDLVNWSDILTFNADKNFSTIITFTNPDGTFGASILTSEDEIKDTRPVEEEDFVDGDDIWRDDEDAEDIHPTPTQTRHYRIAPDSNRRFNSYVMLNKDTRINGSSTKPVTNAAIATELKKYVPLSGGNMTNALSVTKAAGKYNKNSAAYGQNYIGFQTKNLSAGISSELILSYPTDEGYFKLSSEENYGEKNRTIATREWSSEKFATKEDATLSTMTQFGEWTCEPADDGNGHSYDVSWDVYSNRWTLSINYGDTTEIHSGPEDINTTSFIARFTPPQGSITIVTATRKEKTAYVLGSQTDKPLAPAGDYALKEELNVLSNILSDYAQLSNIPVVNDGTFSISCNGQEVGTFSANQGSDSGVNIELPSVGNGTLTIKENGSTLGTFEANQSTNTAIDITVPTVNDGVLTINQNGQSLGTFSANAASNATVNITTPTKTSDLQNDVPFLVQNDLNDYALTSQIPTVNDGTLDIQVNGTSVGTFSANQSGSTTANITVAAPEDGKLTIKDGDGHSLGTFSANQSTDTSITLPTGSTPGNGKLTINYYTDGGTGSDEFTANQTTDTTVNLPAPGNGMLTINYNGNQQESFTANQSSSASITIDPPNDGTLFITVNQQSVGAFSANSAGNVTADIDLSDYATTATVNTLDGKVDTLEGKVNDLETDVQNAQQAADAAQQTANDALDAANNAQNAIDALEITTDRLTAAVDSIGTTVLNIQQQVTTAQQTADNAQQAADDAQQTADNAQSLANSIQQVTVELSDYIDGLSDIYVRRLSGDAYDLSVERLSVDDTFIARNSDHIGFSGLPYGLSIDSNQTKLYANEILVDKIDTDRINSMFGHISELSSDCINLYSGYAGLNEKRYVGHSFYEDKDNNLSLTYIIPYEEDAAKLNNNASADYTLATREWVSTNVSSTIALSDYVKKSDLCAAILPNVSQFNHYLSGDVPYSISSIIEWNKALHTALLSCCGLFVNNQ